MLIVLILIFLLLVGVVATDVITTVIGGAIAVGILAIIFIVKRTKNTPQTEPVDPQTLRIDGDLYCDDCKYCYGSSQAGNCLLGHPNPRAGVFSPICEDDFLPRNAPLPKGKKVR